MGRVRAKKPKIEEKDFLNDSLSYLEHNYRDDGFKPVDFKRVMQVIKKHKHCGRDYKLKYIKGKKHIVFNDWEYFIVEGPR